MTFAHEAVAALPNGSNADAAAIRAMCERRFAYVLDASEDSRNFVETDPVSGVLPQVLFQNNISFLLDPLDSTTVHDGATCLVTNGGKRYKSGTISPPYSVLSRSTSAQPGSPSVGDAYIVPTAATGTAWAGQDGKIGIYTARGWQFAVSPIGREIYVRDVDAYYHRNNSGVWVAGVGAVALQANSVTLQNVLGANASFVIKVENQTTNAPPASPTAPTAYIIGPSPTGAWAGNAGKLAICLVNGSFTIITPVAGDRIYDKAQGNDFRFDGTAWSSAAGAWLAFRSQFTAARLTSATSGTTYTYSESTAPTTSNVCFVDPVTISNYTARKSGATLRFRYSAKVDTASITAGADTIYAIGLFRDSVAAAIAWVALPVVKVGSNGSASLAANAEFVVSAVDASAHTYQIRVVYGGSVGLTNIDRRLFTLEEASS